MMPFWYCFVKIPRCFATLDPVLIILGLVTLISLVWTLNYSELHFSVIVNYTLTLCCLFSNKIDPFKDLTLLCLIYTTSFWFQKCCSLVQCYFNINSHFPDEPRLAVASPFLHFSFIASLKENWCVLLLQFHIAWCTFCHPIDNQWC